jgi:hypothetical protein
MGELRHGMRKFLLLVQKQVVGTVLLLLLCAVAGQAQEARIPLEKFDYLASKAEETVEVTLDERLLRLASKFFNANDPTQAKIKELIANLQGVYVRVFSFGKAGEYDVKEIESLRNQLRTPGWQKIVGVRSRRGGDNVDVHLRMQNDTIAGLAIIAADPRQLTLVNIIGPIDLEKLSQLQGQLGIPKLDLDFGGKGKGRND